MSCIPDMTPTSLVAVVAPRTDKMMKNGLSVLKKGKVCYKMVYYTTLCIYVKPIIRNRVTKLELDRRKSDFSENVF